MNCLEKAVEKFSVLDRVPIGICVLREDFVVLFWNRCLENWTKIPKTKIMGTDITQSFPHLSEPKYASRLKQIFAGGPPTIFSSQLHKHLIPAWLPNGKLQVQHTTVTAEPAPEGGYYALVSIQDVSDLTQQAQNYRFMRDRALAEVEERQQAELAVQQVNDQLQAVLDAVPGLVSWVNSDLCYIGVNHHLCAIFNQPPEAFIGQKLGFLESSLDFADFIREFFLSDRQADRKVIETTSKQIQGYYLIAAQKYQQGQAVVAVGIDITEQKKAEKKLQASLQEKEVLLKEIHHRVKNNLQIISSLLKLQSEYIKDHDVLSVLSDSYNRVRSMSLIHEKLYQSSGLAQIDAAEYIKSLVNNLICSYQYLSNRIDLEVKIEPIFFDIDTAIPCGLIINELICNSLKYAFPEGKAGKIDIKLTTDNRGYLDLEVSDNGIGLPADFDLEMSESLGLQLVTNLTNQLEGQIEINSQTGTVFKIIFPKKGNICPVVSVA
ncbi:sensor histidine kinase [Oscillatoria salina]|uniref:sensor histidine kinase n=1 Tax=Oscillatoria salina TaxID=331517 RepID=UPI0013BDA51E|nr:histidine kinase dimerization/phosphoacceptor domain -containing protein [Oscillatoria salina]MBZ8180359.1 PAS domain-containing protein [Oscillatoria salina IIICB1]NET87957.1 PAS domain-containing protein [Kamptonema sp. SIO1D9]